MSTAIARYPKREISFETRAVPAKISKEILVEMSGSEMMERLVMPSAMPKTARAATEWFAQGAGTEAEF